MEKQRQEYEKQVQQLKIAMTPSTPHPPYYPGGVGNHIGNNSSISGMNNGNFQGMTGGYGSNTHNSNGFITKAIPSTPSVMSGLEKWGQER